MDLRQLEYFVAVAEEANFTRAAQRVHISQSGVSAQIRQLEHELGAQLFDRSGRSATLTVAGKAALEHARAALAAARSVGEAVGGVSELTRGSVSLGMVVGCTVTPLFNALAAFHRAHPGVAISVAEDESVQLIDRVRDGGLDLALVGVANAVPGDLASFVVIGEPIVAVVARDHRLAARRRLRMRDLADESVLCMPAGTGIRAVFDQARAATGVDVAVAVEAGAADAIVALAARGLGVGVLSESMARRYTGKVAALPIADATGTALLALVWREATAGPAARELVRLARRSFRVPAARPAP